MQLQIKKDMPQQSFPKKWQFCVGSCHAATLLRADALWQLKKIHEELGIRYVRCHGIFNDDMHTLTSFQDVLPIPGGEKFIERSFWHCGLVYDNLLDIGMKPFIELSFMPELLAKNKQHGKMLYGSITSLPEDLQAWVNYIRAFIRFLLQRYGQTEVESWYFEVWNEPDLQEMFFQGTQEDYFRLYEATVRAIKSVCPTLQVGGPATSASKWIPEFLAFCEENDVPVDFVSTHQYVGDPFLGVHEETEEFDAQAMQKQMADAAVAFAQAAPDTSFVTLLRLFSSGEHTGLDRDVFAKNAAIVKAAAGKLPVYYTEWNLSASFGGYDNDTRKAAAYDVRTALNTNDHLDGSSIWCYSDIFEELHQFTEEFHGGFGMISLNGIPKPVFYAMKLLAQTGSERLQLDESQFTEVEAAAFTEKGNTQILLYRQTLEPTGKEAEAAAIEMELSDAPKRVWMERIDEDHCNPLHIWEEQGKPKELTRRQAQEIAEQSALREEPLAYRYENGVLTMTVALKENDIYLIHIAEEENEG